MQLTKHWAANLDDYVIDLEWSPDGTRLAAASSAGPISIFTTIDGSRQHELPGHDNGTNAIAWMPVAGRPLAPRAGDVQPETDTNATTAPTPTVGGSVLASGGQDGAVKFWDTNAGQHTATAKLGPAWVEHLAWRPARAKTDRGDASATSNQAGETRLLSPVLFAATGRTLTAIRPDASIAHTFKPAPKTIAALAAEPAGGCVACAYFGGVALWDADEFVAQKEMPYANGIHALVWSPDSRWLVSGNQDPSVHLWIPEADIELHMSGYETKVKFLSFDATSRWLATSGGRDGCVWDCTGDGPEGREPIMLPHESPLCAVKFQHTHGLLATGAQDGTVRLWSPERRQPWRATIKMPVAATKLAWSPDNQYLAIGSEKGVVYVLKCES